MRIYFSEPLHPAPSSPTSWKLYICDFPLINSREIKAFIPANLAKLGDTPCKFQGQKARPLETPHELFLENSSKTQFFFNWLLEFPHFLSTIHLKTPEILEILNSSVCFFFWNGLILTMSQTEDDVNQN